MPEHPLHRLHVGVGADDRFLDLLALNTVGALRITQALLPAMRERGSGRLLYLSSVLGRIVLPGRAAYAATEWALEALIEELAAEVAPFGIHASLLEPGAVASGALDDVEGFSLRDDPYPDLLPERTAGDGATLTVEDAARAIADAAASSAAGRRIPIGPSATRLLAPKARTA